MRAVEQRRPHAHEEDEQDAHHDRRSPRGARARRCAASCCTSSVRSWIGTMPHAARQPPGVDLVHRGVDPLEDLAGVLPSAHEDDALDAAGPARARGSTRRCPSGAGRPPGRARCPGRRSGTLLAAPSTMLSMSSVDWIRPEPRIGQRLPAGVEQRAASVSVVAGTASAIWRMQSLYWSRARGSTSIRYWRTRPPKMTTSATPGTWVRRGRHHPVLDLPELHGVPAGAHQHVAVELADPARERPERGGHALGQLRVAQALQHELAGEIVVDPCRRRSARPPRARRSCESGGR